MLQNICFFDKEMHKQLFVVISQKHWLVSQERLSPRAATSVFIDLIPITPSGERWFSGDLNHTLYVLYGGENHLLASRGKMCEHEFESVLFVQFQSCLVFLFTFGL